MKRELRKELTRLKNAIYNEESVSYDEIHFLQCHQKEVLEYGDVRLAEWSGLSERQWENKELYNKEELLEDLKALNNVEQFQELSIDGTTYTIVKVKWFEDVYEFDKITDFLKEHINKDEIEFLSKAGVYTILREDIYNVSPTFIPFTELATRYKGYVQVRKSVVVIDL